MAAPKKPNTTNAVTASVKSRRRGKHERWAIEMATEGWLPIPPEQADAVRTLIEQADGMGHRDSDPRSPAEMRQQAGVKFGMRTQDEVEPLRRVSDAT